MNRTIFEIAILAFCVSVVLFGAEGHSVLDTVSRSFLVFVAVVVLIIIALVVALIVAERTKRSSKRPDDPLARSRNGDASLGKGSQSIAR